MLEMFPQKVLLTQTMLGVWTPKKLMGYMFIAYGTAVNWKVNLQKVMTLSITKASIFS